MNTTNPCAPGQTFGRWTVLEDNILTPSGARKWLCRCQCGTERYVLEHSLRYGGSQSCGCLRREALSDALAHDLHGRTFGELTVLGRAAPRKNGGLWWSCRCSCGKTVDYPATLLTTGRRTHCGCKTVRRTNRADITGQVFGRLTALHPTARRDAKGSVIWRCQCSCGNETDVSYNSLMYADQRSCGCQKKEHDDLLNTYLTFMDGTSLDAIRSSKLPTDNTTGCKGVYLIRGKYVAKIVFQKKAYYLGTYTSFEDAAQARKQAEDDLFTPTIEFHDKWQQKADTDPDWAAENPIRIFVQRANGSFQVSFLPQL